MGKLFTSMLLLLLIISKTSGQRDNLNGKILELVNNETDQELVLEAVQYMKVILGNENVLQVEPAMVAEDFGKYGRTDEKIPISLFWLGGVNKKNRSY